MRFLIVILFLVANVSFASDVSSVTHSVVKGDSLMTISFKFYGTHQCWKVIQDANGSLENINVIEDGTLLLIPDISLCKHKRKEQKVWNSVTAKIVQPLYGEKIDKTPTKISDDFVMYDRLGQVYHGVPVVSDKKVLDVAGGKKFTIQIGAFKTKDEALINQKKIEELGISPYITDVMIKSQKWYRVRVGNFSSLAQAKEYVDKKKISKYTNNKYFFVEM
jgi:phage tail protein X